MPPPAPPTPARSSFQSGFQYCMRSPDLKQLGRLRLRLLHADGDGVARNCAVVRGNELPSDRRRSRRELRKALIDRRRQLHAAELVARDPIAKAIDQPRRQALRARHRADHRAGIRRVAVRVGEVRRAKRVVHRLQPVASAEPDRHRHERAVRDRVVRRRILDVPAILDRSGDLLRVAPASAIATTRSSA